MSFPETSRFIASKVCLLSRFYTYSSTVPADRYIYGLRKGLIDSNKHSCMDIRNSITTY